jgi:hypothetical protein
LSERAIFFAGAICFAIAFSSRTSSFVHSRRFDLLFAMMPPGGTTRSDNKKIDRAVSYVFEDQK